jgi:hypothetical protein
MMPDGLLALEMSVLGQTVRSSVWIYPVMNVAHVLGAALLLGGIAVFDVSVLARMKGLRQTARVAVPVAALGLVIQMVTGAVLFLPEASHVARNPAFLFKLVLIALGLVNVIVFHRRFGEAVWQDKPMDGARTLALASLVCWTCVLIAGRTIAYV